MVRTFKLRIWHNHNEITEVTTKKVRFLLKDGKIKSVDTDERLFYDDITMIELG